LFWFELVYVPGDSPADESENFRLPAARGVVGFISPVSKPYCGTCNRMRLTAEWQSADEILQ